MFIIRSYCINWGNSSGPWKYFFKILDGWLTQTLNDISNFSLSIKSALISNWLFCYEAFVCDEC